MSDDFNIDDYLNDPEFENKMEAYRDRMIFEAINTNYEKIKENGISDWQLRHMEKQEILELKETLTFMTKHYIDLEQYERCSLLKSELDKLESHLERVS
jgi:hypothetical protein|tara:strand:- start:1496 stop:1792 length:297 start_codon:yes stop_codon:yes gene_type:complete